VKESTGLHSGITTIIVYCATANRKVIFKCAALDIWIAIIYIANGTAEGRVTHDLIIGKYTIQDDRTGVIVEHRPSLIGPIVVEDAICDKRTAVDVVHPAAAPTGILSSYPTSE